MHSRNVMYIAIALFIVLFGVFIWPGMNKYEELDHKYPVRINRITGHTEILYDKGWTSIGNASSGSAGSNASDVPAAWLANITGDFKIVENGEKGYLLTGQLYNGNDATVSQVVIQLNLYYSWGALKLSRKYKLPEPCTGLNTVAVYQNLDFSMKGIGKWDYTIVSAKSD